MKPDQRKCFFSIDASAKRMFSVQTRFSELCAVVHYDADGLPTEVVVLSSLESCIIAVYTPEDHWIDPQFTTLLGDLDVIGMVPRQPKEE